MMASFFVDSLDHTHKDYYSYVVTVTTVPLTGRGLL